MTIDLGPLEDLATALGLFVDGDPNPDWFGHPENYLSTMLTVDAQRDALVSFVDDALGGQERTTDPSGATWLTVVDSSITDSPFDVAITIDDSADDHVALGLGIAVRTTDPTSSSTLQVPLFRAAKHDHTVPNPFLLGAVGGRIRMATTITVTTDPPTSGVARIGSIGLELDIPTAAGDRDPSFALLLGGLQLPGAATPRDVRISADGADELDDAVLDLVLSLVRAQLDGAAGTPVHALGGMLGLVAGDHVPDFPITQLADHGVAALTTWLHDLFTVTVQRQAWVGYVANLFGVGAAGDSVVVPVGDAEITLGLVVDTGPSGNPQIRPTLTASLTDGDGAVEARAELCRIDLVTGAATALPSLGAWARYGRDVDGHRALDLSAPTARAATLRVGFALDESRRLAFVLAADGVTLGTRPYATVDLTSPDAVMDAAGQALEDVADELLGQLGGALAPVKVLLGVEPPVGAPPGFPTVGLAALLSDPVGAVTAHWQTVLQSHVGQVPAVLETLRDAIADQAATAVAVTGSGTDQDPWRVPLVGPFGLMVRADGARVQLDVGLTTSVSDLGQHCTTVETTLTVRLAELDLAARTASVLAGVEARLHGRENGVTPPCARLALVDGVAVQASYVGLRLGWTPTTGLTARADVPDLRLLLDTGELPVTLPVLAADGSVTLDEQSWDAVQELIGHLTSVLPSFLRDLTTLLGWTPADVERPVVLRLADLVSDPAAALAAWLPEVALSELGPRALAFVADLLSAAGPASGVIRGTGRPSDPYVLDLHPGLPVPELAVWFPPAGPNPRLVNAPDEIRRWRPGDLGLGADALATALEAEAGVDDGLLQLVAGRPLAAGLEDLVARWTSSDGVVVAPATTPPGVRVVRRPLSAGQLGDVMDLPDLLGHDATTLVHVALLPPGSAVSAAAAASVWPAAPADRLVDLTAPGLAPTMFAPPTPAPGEWFVVLGARAACLLATGDDDGTFGQVARLRVVLDALATAGPDLAVVGHGGAGHACRLAAERQTAVTDVVTVGTALGPVSATALSHQPGADALRLLASLLPPEPAATEVEDDDLALGRGLVSALLGLAPELEPLRALQLPATALPTPRAGLSVHAVFGAPDRAAVQRAVTAVVAAGLARRARLRASGAVSGPEGLRAGLRFAARSSDTGTLRISGTGLLTLLALDAGAAPTAQRDLVLDVEVSDRLAWLAATPDLEVRKVGVHVHLAGTGSPGDSSAAITLHDARVLGQTWERLVVGTGPDTVPVGPEVRRLLSVAVNRVVTDIEGEASLALRGLLEALGLVAGGGAVFDAFDQLVHDPAGLVAQRLATAQVAVAAALDGLLGPLGSSISLTERSVSIEAGSPATGLFGWAADVTASPAGLSGRVTVGPDAQGVSAAGGLQLVVDLAPLTVRLDWRHPARVAEAVPLWPNPDGAQLAQCVARSAPSLAGHVALEIMRRADESAQPIIDAALDALGLLSGSVGDSGRHLRPLAGLLADPAGWLRSADSLAGSPTRIQSLLDAMRPLLGVAGAPGDPWPLAPGVGLAVVPVGADARLDLTVDPSAWDDPGGDRIAAGLSATLMVSASGAPSPGLDLHLGVPGATTGRQALHLTLGPAGVGLFLRPTSGPDVTLLPFAGMGGLASAAQAALPFLLDKLAAAPAPVGPLLVAIGDGLELRAGAPLAFSGPALIGWAQDPVGRLAASLDSLVSVGIDALADLVDDLVPAGISVGEDAGSLTATCGPFTLTWDPAAGAVTLRATRVAVPGVDLVSFAVTVSDTGLQDFTVTVGPTAIAVDTAVLRPFVTVAAGEAPAGGRRVVVGLAADDTHRFAAQWLLDPGTFDLVAYDGPLDLPLADPGLAALRAAEVLCDLLAAVAMATDAVSELLRSPVFDSTVRGLMAGVVLDDAGAALIPGLFDVSTLVARAARLFENIAGAGIEITLDEALKVRLTEIDDVIGLKAELSQRWTLVDSDVSLYLENEDSWITDNPPGNGGLFVGVVSTSGGLSFEPSLGVYGVGVRLGRRSGPLIDSGLTIESVALHTFAELGLGGAKAGGLQLELTNLAAAPSGASGGNSIASGIMNDTGEHPPQPAFSPALAVQKHGTSPVEVTLRAGPGDGPWWVAIQRGFGPLYLEQVGLGVTLTPPPRRIEKLSLLMDGSVSLFGLTCAVDDLQITYLVSRNDFFNPASWDIDLAGLAVSADLAGLSVSGGLLKQTSAAGTEYLGMLMARFGVYGITIYGGYGEGVDHGEKFVAFFAVGSLVGPIGGPPAFFLTGIGGGFGINRELVIPTDLSTFGEFPLLKALDVAAKPGNPMDELRSLGTAFPMKRGTFWFAAGISFTSFALVDGIAVVAIEVGDGLDVNLLGLARMALPRPQVALVSIEIALLVRFSTSEGVLWVQGQLTDNSWLLYRDVRLTGGFAFVTWFKGEHRGEFVLSLGGFHPDFHRDGYPVVPRLGLRWQFGSSIVITAGSYFALTSEAVMAGGDFEAAADFGPAWARVAFGAHGIVYFDPFHYSVLVFARIDAGVTIDTWLFGEITISVHLGARVEVEGPDFHGRARFEVGPVGLTVEFGSKTQEPHALLSGADFTAKYLEPSDGGAVVLSVITTFGVQPSGAGKPTADGTPDRPFVVVCEFGLIVTSTVPLRSLSPAPAIAPPPPSRMLGVAPMGTANLAANGDFSWQVGSSAQPFPFDVTARPHGAFPVGVWGPPQDDSNRKVPEGEIINALHEAALDSRATPSVGGPEIAYHQVEINKRIPLPFKRQTPQVTQLKNSASDIAALVSQPMDVDQAFALATDFLAATTTPVGLAALRRERQAPPRVGTLAEGLDATAASVVPSTSARPAGKVVDAFVDAPLAVGLLRAGTPVTAPVSHPPTTVKDAGRLWRTTPPTLASVDAERSRSIASSLVLMDTAAAPTLARPLVTRAALDSPRATARAGSVVATGSVPRTAQALGPQANVARIGAAGGSALTAFDQSLTARRRVGRGSPGAVLEPGDVAVLQLPNARHDVGDDERPRLGVSGAPARVIVLGHGGVPLSDTVADPAVDRTGVEVPAGSERLVVVGLGEARAGGSPEPEGLRLDGWHSALQLPYLGWSSALGRGCTVRSVGQPMRHHRERLDAGWVSGAELAIGRSTVVTRFTAQVRTVIIVLDDPTSLGEEVPGRRIVMGLTGAERLRDAAGRERPPALLSAESRSVLAYDIVVDGTGTVTVTIASETGWSLVGVLGSAELSAESALSLVSSLGLDAATGALHTAPTGRTRVEWLGRTRTDTQRQQARAAALGRPSAPPHKKRTR